MIRLKFIKKCIIFYSFKQKYLYRSDALFELIIKHYTRRCKDKLIDGFWLVMGLGQKNLTWVGSNFSCSSQVGSTIFCLSLGLENFPPKSQIFNFFPAGQKKYLQVVSKSIWVKGWSASYLLLVKSMLWVRAYLYFWQKLIFKKSVTFFCLNIESNHGINVCLQNSQSLLS